MKNLKKKEKRSRIAGAAIYNDYIRLHEVKNMFKRRWLKNMIKDLEKNHPETMTEDEQTMFDSVMKYLKDKLQHVNNHLR